MAFENNYIAGQQYENGRDVEAAVLYYSQAIRDVLPTHTETESSKAQVRHAVDFLEAWLKRQSGKLFKNAGDRAFVRESLGIWYSQAYSLQPERAILVDDQNSLNYAPLILDDRDILESYLHSYWKIAKSDTTLDLKKSLNRIYEMKQDPVLIQTLVSAQAPRSAVQTTVEAIISADAIPPLAQLTTSDLASHSDITNAPHATLYRQNQSAVPSFQQGHELSAKS